MLEAEAATAFQTILFVLMLIFALKIIAIVMVLADTTKSTALMTFLALSTPVSVEIALTLPTIPCVMTELLVLMMFVMSTWDVAQTFQTMYTVNKPTSASLMLAIQRVPPMNPMDAFLNQWYVL
jgi:hypothetical protein